VPAVCTTAPQSYKLQGPHMRVWWAMAKSFEHNFGWTFELPQRNLLILCSCEGIGNRYGKDRNVGIELVGSGKSASAVKAAPGPDAPHGMPSLGVPSFFQSSAQTSGAFTRPAVSFLSARGALLKDYSGACTCTGRPSTMKLPLRVASEYTFPTCGKPKSLALGIEDDQLIRLRKPR
jgi:hypothetical protein